MGPSAVPRAPHTAAKAPKATGSERTPIPISIVRLHTGRSVDMVGPDPHRHDDLAAVRFAGIVQQHRRRGQQHGDKHKRACNQRRKAKPRHRLRPDCGKGREFLKITAVAAISARIRLT